MNWRDYTSLFSIAVVLVAIGAVVIRAPVIEQITNWGWATVLLAFLGLLIFTVISPLAAPTSKPESLAMALLGMLAIIIAFTGAFMNNKWMFLTLCINLVVLWALATVYHIQANEERHSH